MASAADKPRRRRRWWWVLASLATTTTICVAIVFLLVTCRPSWYQPSAIDYGMLREDKAALVGLENDISAALNRDRSITFEISEDQVNRWIAAREEMWPDWVFDLGTMRDPMVDFQPGKVRIAALAERGALRSVVTLTLSCAVEADKIDIFCDALHLGALPAPGRAHDQIRDALPPADELLEPSAGALLTVGNDWHWPNGRPRYRVQRIEFTDDLLTVEFVPLSGG